MYRKKKRIRSREFIAMALLMAVTVFSSSILSYASETGETTGTDASDEIGAETKEESEKRTENETEKEMEENEKEENGKSKNEASQEERTGLAENEKMDQDSFPEAGYIWGKDSKKTDTGLTARLRGGRMARSAAGADAYIQPGTSHSYGSWSTHEYHVTTSDGQFLGYCAQPNLASPNGTYQISELDNDMIKAALLIAPGGVPRMYEDFGKNIYNEADGNVYAYAHALIGYLYMGSLQGLSASMAQGVQNMVNVLTQVSHNPLAPTYPIFQDYFKQYKVYVACSGSDSVQDIVWLEGNSVGRVKIKKTSANRSITEGNPCYSLAGAEYGVYSDAACTRKVATMTTDENGSTEEKELDAGTYYIRELKASPGYDLDTCGTKKTGGGWMGNAHLVTVESGETRIVSCTEPARVIPVDVLLGKVDAETNQNKPQGGASLEGALFTVKFYSGIWSGNANPGDFGKRAARTWVFRTDSKGECRYETKYLSSGDELYLSLGGKPGLPLGTLTIQETKAPNGYLLNPEDYVIKITGNDSYNKPVIPEDSLKLEIKKTAAPDEITDRANGRDVMHPVPGAVFLHMMPDGTTERVITDRQGQTAVKGLTHGKHSIEEISVPDGYTRNPGKVTFEVAEDNTIMLKSNTSKDATGIMNFVTQKDGGVLLSVQDRLAPYQLAVHKENEQGKKLEGAEFTIYSDQSCTKQVGRGITDADGIIGFGGLKVGVTYYLKETKAPKGYRIPLDSAGRDIVYQIRTKSNPEEELFQYFVNDKDCTSDKGAVTGTKAKRIVNQTVINHTSVKLPETGSPFTFISVLAGAGCIVAALFYLRKKGRSV